MRKYRVEHGKVYEYRASEAAYVFIGNLLGRTLSEFLKDRDRW
jgi:hypothetical protein